VGFMTILLQFWSGELSFTSAKSRVTLDTLQKENIELWERVSPCVPTNIHLQKMETVLRQVAFSLQALKGLEINTE
uniref:Uncharacterized protein n=1 Tax=Anser brachyrhynchus TaxID=132585 RepID=A0A8B9C4Z4_9AVES